jgi:O-antigen ligase
LFALTAVGLLVAGLVSALSRGGWVAMAAGLAAVSTVLARNRGTTLLAWTGLVALLMSLGLIHWLGRSPAVEARWQRLVQQMDEPTDGRLAHWSDSLNVSRDFWLLGTGIGTYRYAYRPYEREFRQKTFYHAENQYIEALTVGGLVGLGLLLAAVGLAGWSSFRLLAEPRDSTAFMTGIVGLYALVSQGVHALFDFGLFLPANMALMALLMGSVAGRAAQVATTASSRSRMSRASEAPVLPKLLKLRRTLTRPRFTSTRSPQKPCCRARRWPVPRSRKLACRTQRSRTQSCRTLACRTNRLGPSYLTNMTTI